MNTAKKIIQQDVVFSMEPAPALSDRQLNRRMSEIADLDAEIKALQDRRDALKKEVTEALGAIEEHTTGKYQIRYKTVVSSRLDGKALKADHPRVYAEYIRPSSCRRFEYKVIAG